MSLEHEAIKLYWEKINGEYYHEYETIEYNSFVPIFKIKDLVYIHTFSVVSYCHRNYPDKFCELTRTALCEALPQSIVLSKGGSSHSFRIIAQQQFEEIVL